MLTEPSQSNRPCNVGKIAPCPEPEVCVRPAPNVRCDTSQLDKCPGTCQLSCSLDDLKNACPFGQSCTTPALPNDDPGIGYCPEPAFCGGIAGIQCQGEGETCIDDPRDDCDLNPGDFDCAGICVVVQDCHNQNCPEGYQCFDNSKDLCNPQFGDKDCPSICSTRPIEVLF